MSRISFENYGELAKSLESYALISGRYSIQEEAGKNILIDIITKLELKASDSVLDIGCGPGNLLIPLSFIVKEITGIDHESCLERLQIRFPERGNVDLIAGNFLDVSLDKIYDKILCYSVLHYLENKDEVFKFIDKALQFLTPGGKALFGDIPNQSLKNRFICSKQGKKFNKEWQELLKNENTNDHEIPILDTDDKLVWFDDDFILDILARYREKGFHTYVLPQPLELPFGNTREDILIVKLD